MPFSCVSGMNDLREPFPAAFLRGVFMLMSLNR